MALCTLINPLISLKVKIYTDGRQLVQSFLNIKEKGIQTIYHL